MDVADGYFARGRAERVLVVAAEKVSRLVDWSDRATCVLFGDGAAAAVLGAGGENPLATRLTTDPTVEVLHVPGVPGTSPYDKTDRPQPHLAMEGRRVFKFGVNAIVTSVTELCDEAGVSVSDIDHFVFHQANERILSSAVSRLGIDDAKVARAPARASSSAASSSPSSALARASTRGRACCAGSAAASPDHQSIGAPAGRMEKEGVPTMADQTTFDRVCAIIREQAGADDVELTAETKLSEVGLDSLSTVEAVMACEDEFGIEIDAESNPATVGEFVSMVESLLEN